MPHLPVTWRGVVLPEWVDRNDHMNVGYYMVVFDEATTAFFDYCGMDAVYRQRLGVATFTLEAHATYERELRRDDPVQITTQLLDWSAKKVHYFHRMFHGEAGYLAATNELLSLHVDASRHAAPFAAGIRERFAALRQQQGALQRPSRAGRIISVEAKRPGAGG